MIISESQQRQALKQRQLGFKPEDKIWACNFEVASTINIRYPASLDLHCKPEQGYLVCGKKKDSHERAKKHEEIAYFVPMKKTGEPAWSRVVEIESRWYADTEEECQKLYNYLVEQGIKEYKSVISDLMTSIVNFEKLKF